MSRILQTCFPEVDDGHIFFTFLSTFPQFVYILAMNASTNVFVQFIIECTFALFTCTQRSSERIKHLESPNCLLLNQLLLLHTTLSFLYASLTCVGTSYFENLILLFLSLLIIQTFHGRNIDWEGAN